MQKCELKYVMFSLAKEPNGLLGDTQPILRVLSFPVLRQVQPLPPYPLHRIGGWPDWKVEP